MIYATGDLHGNSLRFQPQYFPEQAKMTKDDYMIVCGDFGCVWNGDKSDDPQLDRLEALPFTVLFVDGNHENFDALSEYPVELWHSGKVHKIRPHVIHLMRGQAFELQGRTFFTMGGAQSHDIADGILDMESSDFYGQYDSLCRNRGQFLGRTHPDGGFCGRCGYILGSITSAYTTCGRSQKRWKKV